MKTVFILRNEKETEKKDAEERDDEKKNGILFYISRTICNECATLIGSLHDRSSEDAFRMLVYVVNCPERVKSSDQTMSNEKKK